MNAFPILPTAIYTLSEAAEILRCSCLRVLELVDDRLGCLEYAKGLRFAGRQLLRFTITEAAAHDATSHTKPPRPDAPHAGGADRPAASPAPSSPLLRDAAGAPDREGDS